MLVFRSGVLVAVVVVVVVVAVVAVRQWGRIQKQERLFDLEWLGSRSDNDIHMGVANGDKGVISGGLYTKAGR